ncbi:MAG: hypothetical protein OEW60_04760, partial [Thiovulaceae bacterium]|nr:hypothetical protein [Sulfurimonadaceae bacterium]
TIVFCVNAMKDNTKLIINQRYIQKDANTQATLIDLYGNEALIQTQNGLNKISIEIFKTNFNLLPSL